MIRYVHTNLIARDGERLIAFYREALGCRSIGERRDLRGEWLDRLTGLTDAHLVGEHLCLPGYGQDHPTLEIFTYDAMPTDASHGVNTPGFAHIAFEVDDVTVALERVLHAGGGQVGDVVRACYADGRRAEFVYATDPEGNILELQTWS